MLNVCLYCGMLNVECLVCDVYDIVECGVLLFVRNYARGHLRQGLLLLCITLSLCSCIFSCSYHHHSTHPMHVSCAASCML